MSDGPRRPRRWTRWVTLVATALVAAGVLSPAPTLAQEPSADLSVSIARSPSSPLAGLDLDLTITATNDGPDVAADVVAGVSFAYPLRSVSSSEGCDSALSGSVCSLGDLGSGSSASATITVQALASGVYTIPVVASSETADPDTEDRSLTETVLVRRGPTIGTRYVAGIYPIILDRPGTPEGRSYWADRFDEAFSTFPRSLSSVPLGLISSREHRRLRVRESYQRVLGRSVDSGALTFWSAAVAGATSYARLDQLLIASGEFRGKHPDDAVAAVFQAVLRRAPSAAETATWDSRLASGTSLARMAATLQSSTEGYDVIINDRVQRTLGHGPSTFLRYIWQVELRQGTSAERLWAQLLTGQEILSMYPPTDADTPVGPVPVPIPVSGPGFRFKPS